MRFLDYTQLRTTVGRTPLDAWPHRRKDLYLTTHNTHNRQTSMPPVGFEPATPAGERPQTCALDRAATGTGAPASVFSVPNFYRCIRQCIFCTGQRAENNVFIFVKEKFFFFNSAMYRGHSTNSIYKIKHGSSWFPCSFSLFSVAPAFILSKRISATNMKQ